MKIPKIALVIPCYNEEEMIKYTFKEVDNKLKEMKKNKLIDKNSYILFIDDGSKDTTWNIIHEYHLDYENTYVRGIKLSKNCGHQNALLSGLLTAKEDTDCVISMDADLQDDINILDEFIKKYNDGFEIVYGVRSSRKKDTFFKRNSALFFYKFMSYLGINIIHNHAHYRLLSKKVLIELEKFKEKNIFIKGIIPSIGFKSTKVYYERHERIAGETKYPLKKMIEEAFEGITSFSIEPIKLITKLGFGFILFSLFFIMYSLLQWLKGDTVSGWTSIIISIWFIGGLQLISIGLVGEYIGKIYKEVKGRPLYIIETYLNNDK